MDMISEQNPIKEIVPIKDKINSSSVTEIAGFYDRIMEDEHLNNPEFGACELFEAAAKNLPLKIDHNKKQEALEAISSEDENIQSVGKRAFQFLSLNTILAVVNENYDRKIDSKEDGDEMFMDAITHVIENASRINPKSGISDRVGDMARMGIYLYFSKKNNIHLVVNESSITKEDIAYTKNRNNTRNERSLTVKDAESQVRDEEASLEKVEARDRQENLETDVKKILLNFLPERDRQIVTQWFQLDGVKRNQEEIGEDFKIGRAAVSKILIEAIDGLRYDPASQKTLQEYKDTM